MPKMSRLAFSGLLLLSLLVLSDSLTASEKMTELRKKHHKRSHSNSKRRSISCDINWFLNSKTKQELCSWLQKNDKTSILDHGPATMTTSNEWCHWSESIPTNQIQLRFDVKVNYPSDYTAADKTKFNSLVTAAYDRFFKDRAIAALPGKKLAVSVQVNEISDSFAGKAFDYFFRKQLLYRIQDDSSAMTQIQKRVGRVASMNLEFLIGQGIFFYLPRATLHDPSSEAKIMETVVHEMGHSVMAVKSIPYSLTHKGTSTVGQEPISGLPKDTDVLTYADKSGPEQFTDIDIAWLILSCV